MWIGFSTAFSMGCMKSETWMFVIVIVAALGGLLLIGQEVTWGNRLHEDLYFSSISIMLEWSIAFPILPRVRKNNQVCK